MVAALSIAALASCTSEKPQDGGQPSTSPVWMKFESSSDFVMGEPGPLALAVDNSESERSNVDVSLSLSLEHAPKGDVAIEYQDLGSSRWKDLRLSPKATGGKEGLTGTFQTALPSGRSTLKLRLTPGMRPTDSGQSIGVTARMSKARTSLAVARSSAPLTNFQVEEDSGAEYVQRGGGWSEYDFSVKNHSAVDYPKIQILAFLCEEVEGDCRAAESTSALSVQWKTADGWKDLEIPSPGPAPTSDAVQSLEDDAALVSDIPLSRDESKPLHFRIKETGDLRAGSWQGQIQLTARLKGTKSTTALSSEGIEFHVK
ncbi:hypothetical protein [Streptomyces sp. DSM 40484]|uniref:hypothetical protein n=1 Tax=Streptomyces kroppenstedtii TaxID=3051181 RepID=UPI0028D8187E|nr:hypothetical protein [Streptomyces sp. DSM 40484]